MTNVIDYDDFYGTIQYYGVWDNDDGFYVDIKRFNKTIGFSIDNFDYVKLLADKDGMLHPNGKIPKHYDMITKEMTELRSIWNAEYLPLLNSIKTPKQVEDDTRLSMLCYTSDMDDFDEICLDSMIAGIRRMTAYTNILRTIYLQYFCMTISKCEQIIYKLISDCGYDNDGFSFKEYIGFLEKRNINNNDFTNSQEFDGMRKIYIFLKHGTKDTFKKLSEVKYSEKYLFIKEYNKDRTSIEYITHCDILLNDAFSFCEQYLFSLCEKLTKENTFSELETKEYYLHRAKSQLLNF